MKNWLWIGGWGLPPEWLQKIASDALPADRHHILPPRPDLLAEIDWTRFDRVAGFSLGAFLLLQNQHQIPFPALLLSPFFGYTSEMNLGGKIRSTQIRYLARWIQRDPLAALADFHTRANLPIPAPTELPYPLEDLLWGLDILSTQQTPPTLPPNWTALLGQSDPLLDAEKIHALEPRIQLIENAGHDPRPLLLAWKTQSDG